MKIEVSLDISDITREEIVAAIAARVLAEICPPDGTLLDRLYHEVRTEMTRTIRAKLGPALEAVSRRAVDQVATTIATNVADAIKEI
jgi:hypothetical protein